MKKYAPYFYLFLVSLIVVLFFSTSTTFIYDEPCSGDSAIFQIIGKYWAEGRLPYVDVWDQKGPFIFFVDAIGYVIAGNKYGIFLLQIINLTIVSWILYNICRIELKVLPSILISTLVMFSFAPVCENTVEEWILIPICWFYYVMTKWVNKVEASGQPVKHPLSSGFVYGMVVGLSLMTRLTNAVGICMASLVIAIYLAINKEWRNIVGNVFLFVGGLLLTTVPFFIYFYANDALYEMWYGTFLYNAEYAGSSGFGIFSFKGMANLVLRFENCYFLLLVSVMVLVLNKSRRFAGILWLTMSLACMLWFLRSNGFGQYATICLPFSCIAFIEIYHISHVNKNWLAMRSYVLSNIAYSFIVIVGVVYSMWLFNNMYRENSALYEFRTFMKDIPSEYRKSFAAYNCNPDWYLYEDIHPNSRFFTLQDFQTGMGKSLLPKVRDAFSGKTQWLLVKGKKTKIDDIIEKNYMLYKREGDLTLYKLK